jgi:chromosome segregation ATPase
MKMAIKKIDITAPPNSLFQGISTDYQDNLTYAEFLLGVLKKLNETIDEVNSHQEFIENYSGQIEEMQRQLAEFEDEWNEYKIDLNASIEEQITAFKTEVYAKLETEITQLRAYVDARDAVLKDYIDNVALGQIYVYNPTTGEKQDLQSVINSLFDVSREDALSASEYDALALTATYYDGQDISAYDYDTVGKTLLVG